MATRQDLTVHQGETWAFTHTHISGGSPVNLTGYTARMRVKASFADGFLAYLSTGADASGGTITLGGALGTITLAMTASESSILAAGSLALPVSAEDPTLFFRYDLEIISPAGVVTRVLEGRFILRREVTA